MCGRQVRGRAGNRYPATARPEGLVPGRLVHVPCPGQKQPPPARSVAGCRSAAARCTFRVRCRRMCSLVAFPLEYGELHSRT
jgi:hypothetical protein